ncbi:MAG: alpha/beta hydrolase family protein [Actinomycetota bacterium]
MAARPNSRPHRTVPTVGIPFVAVFVALVAAASLSGVTATAVPAGAATAPQYAKPGPYAAGVTTLDLPDRKVEVWYPVEKTRARGKPRATFDVVTKAPPAIVALLPAGTGVPFETDAVRDLPAASRKGGFPLILMAHGTAGYREQLSFLATHLASWGFVVASPDITERGLSALLGSPPANTVDDVTVMRQTEALLRAESDRTGGPLAGRVLKGRVAVTGQSAGGTTALRYGAEPGVVTAIPISASGLNRQTGAYDQLPDVPLMFVSATGDQIVPIAGVEEGFRQATPPARLVEIGGAGHASLAGVCPIGGPGGLVGLANSASLPVPDGLKRLASDGCANPAPNPDPSWAPVAHAVTAQLREAFGIDRKPVGLSQKTMNRFAPVVVTYQQRL